MVTSPELGSSNPTTMRATVVFPEPDSPTRAKVSPLAMSNVTPSTAFRNSSSPPSRTRLSHGFETSKTRRRLLTLTRGAVMPRYPSQPHRRDDTPRLARLDEWAPAVRHGSDQRQTRSAG